MHPPFTGLIMKEVPSSGDTLHGKFIPGGTRIGHSVWSVMRNPSIFGDDVNVFRPERWLNVDHAKASQMERAVDLVFGYGCAGKSVAFMELNKIFVEVSRPRGREGLST